MEKAKQGKLVIIKLGCEPVSGFTTKSHNKNTGILYSANEKHQPEQENIKGKGQYKNLLIIVSWR